ncbi:uncharacterized protein [Pempheris klunzingeri]|uniref:uncharacterized protein n=1 Tax=Pempheris klunzingeri TaxID=3127111 RepID=UPI003981869B
MTNALLQSDMQKYLLRAISCLCLLHTGLIAEECSPTVLAKRDTFYVPAGGSLSLSCVVQHCGDTWKGGWMWRNSTDESMKVTKENVWQTNVTVSANQIQLNLNFLSVNQSDEGFYGCRVKWDEGDTAMGHLVYVNVTAAVLSQRSVLLRVVVCASALLCLPIILGLARCLSSKVNPQPLPRTLSTHPAEYRGLPHPAPQPPSRCPVPQKRTMVPQKRSTSSHKAPTESQQKAEVVYADISQEALRQQGATREPDQSTVYSALRFS